jgi:membrane protease YdiL (CAAX protease family)
MKTSRACEAGLGCMSLVLFSTLLFPLMIVLGLFQVVLFAHHLAGGGMLFAGGQFDVDALLYDPTTWTALRSTLFPPWLLVASTLLQNAGMLLLAVVLILSMSSIRHRSIARKGLLDDMRRGFALDRGALAIVAIAALSTPCIGWVSGLLTELMSLVLPNLDGFTIKLLTDCIDAATGFEMVMLIATLAVIVPIAEELLFRGYLWDALQRWLPSWAVLIVTALIFALFHGSPLHIVGVLPVGIFLGWLRMTSGSVYAPIVAHMINNALAVVMYIFLGEQLESTGMTLAVVLGLVGGLVCGIAAYMSWRWRPSLAKTG